MEARRFMQIIIPVQISFVEKGTGKRMAVVTRDMLYHSLNKYGFVSPIYIYSLNSSLSYMNRIKTVNNSALEAEYRFHEVDY